MVISIHVIQLRMTTIEVLYKPRLGNIQTEKIGTRISILYDHLSSR